MNGDNRIEELVMLIRETDALLPWQTELRDRKFARMLQLADSLHPEGRAAERLSERVMREAQSDPGYRR